MTNNDKTKASAVPDDGGAQLVWTNARRGAFGQLTAATLAQKPVTALVGELGVGKATMLREWRKQTSRTTRVFWVSGVTGQVDVDGATLAEAFGVLPGSEVLARIRNVLEDAPGGITSNILVVEDAQALPDRLLGKLALMTKMESAERPLLQLILSGDAALYDILEDPAAFPDAEIVDLPNLTETATGTLFKGRLNDLNVNSSVVESLHDLTAGNPGQVLALADAANEYANDRGQNDLDDAGLAAVVEFVQARPKQPVERATPPEINDPSKLPGSIAKSDDPRNMLRWAFGLSDDEEDETSGLDGAALSLPPSRQTGASSVVVDNQADLNKAIAEIAARETAARQETAPEPMPELPFGGDVDPTKFRHGAEALAGIMKHDRRLSPADPEALAKGPAMSAPAELKEKLLAPEPPEKRSGWGRRALIGGSLLACFGAGAYLWPLVQDQVLAQLGDSPQASVVAPVLEPGPVGVFTDPAAGFAPDLQLALESSVVVPASAFDPNVGDGASDGSVQIANVNPYQTEEQDRTAAFLETAALSSALTAEVDAAENQLASMHKKIADAERRLATLVSEEDLILSDIATLRNEQLEKVQDAESARAELAEVLAQQNAAQQILAKLGAEKAAAQTALDDLFAKRVTAEQSVADLESAQASSRAKVDALSAQQASTKQIISDLEAQKTDVQSALAALVGEKDTAVQAVIELTAEKAKAKTLLDELRAQAADAKQAVADLNSERAIAQKAVDALAAEKASIGEAIAGTRTRMEALEASFTTRRSELQDREAAAENANLAQTVLQEELAALQAKKKDAEALLAELHAERVAIKKTVNLGQAEVVTLQESLAVRTAEIDRADGILAQMQEAIAKQKQELTAVRSLAAQATQDLAAAQEAQTAALEAVNDATYTRDGIVAEQVALAAKLDDVREDLTDLEIRKAAVSAEIASAQAAFDEKIALLTGADGKVQSATAHYDALQATIAQLQQQEAELKEALKNRHSDLEQTTAALDAAKAELDAASTTRQSVISDLEQAEARQVEAQGVLDGLKAQTQAANADLTSLRGQRDELQLEVDKLAEILGDDKAERTRALTTIAQTKSELRKVSRQITSSQSELTELNARKLDADQIIAALTQRAAGLTQELDGLKVERARTAEALHAEEQRLAALKAEADALAATDTASNAALDEKLAQLSDAEAQLQTVLARLAAAQPQPLPDLGGSLSPREAATVDAALVRSPGLDALNSEQATALRTALVDGYCVVDALKATTGRANPFTVRALRKLVGACDK